LIAFEIFGKLTGIRFTLMNCLSVSALPFKPAELLQIRKYFEIRPLNENLLHSCSNLINPFANFGPIIELNVPIRDPLPSVSIIVESHLFNQQFTH
jgi:hypothetical protein